MHGGGGICGRGACMAGKTTTAADSAHPTGMNSCSLTIFRGVEMTG